MHELVSFRKSLTKKIVYKYLHFGDDVYIFALNNQEFPNIMVDIYLKKLILNRFDTYKITCLFLYLDISVLHQKLYSKI